jgi:hypothetical protein
MDDTVALNCAQLPSTALYRRRSETAAVAQEASGFLRGLATVGALVMGLCIRGLAVGYAVPGLLG